MTTANRLTDTPPGSAGDSRRLLLSCPACGSSRAVAPLDQASVGAVATLRCAACGLNWREIISPYSPGSQDDV